MDVVTRTEPDLVARYFRRAVLLLAGACFLGLVLWGWKSALSVALGGALAIISFLATRTGIDRIFKAKADHSDGMIIVAYLFRLVLISACLFAIIHFSFLSLFGTLFGLSIFVLAGFWEAIALLVRK